MLNFIFENFGWIYPLFIPITYICVRLIDFDFFGGYYGDREGLYLFSMGWPVLYQYAF